MLSWLAYSDHERDKALDLVALLREREARDELGLGTIRDTLSDLLFPGTSTLHTRARYFLFIPRIYAAIEGRKLTAAEMEARGRKAEVKLCEALKAGGETDGVIGRIAGRDLKRLASSIYWNGLRTWRVFQKQTAQREYLKAAASTGRRASLIPDGDAAELGHATFWDATLPSGPDGNDAAVTFALTASEAEYLALKIRDHHSETLLKQLLDKHRPTLSGGAPWLWIDPETLSDGCRRELEHARMFSDLAYAAVLVYNLLLAEKSVKTSQQDEYRAEIADHGTYLAARAEQVHDWNELDFWAMLAAARQRLPSAAPISHTARQFTSEWFRHLRSGTLLDLADDTNARRLVSHREQTLKGRFSRVAGGRPLDLWQGASGVGQLNFRWNQVKRVMTDIRSGLGYENA